MRWRVLLLPVIVFGAILVWFFAVRALNPLNALRVRHNDSTPIIFQREKDEDGSSLQLATPWPFPLKPS
jgi:hypothetical protein